MATEFPGIMKAAVLMAGCNGGINRDRPECDFREEVRTLLDPKPGHELAAIDAWLDSLSDHDLLTAVDGEQLEMRTLLSSSPHGTHSLLFEIFEQVV